MESDPQDPINPYGSKLMMEKTALGQMKKRIRTKFHRIALFQRGRGYFRWFDLRFSGPENTFDPDRFGCAVGQAINYRSW